MVMRTGRHMRQGIQITLAPRCSHMYCGRTVLELQVDHWPIHMFEGHLVPSAPHRLHLGCAGRTSSFFMYVQLSVDEYGRDIWILNHV